MKHESTHIESAPGVRLYTQCWLPEEKPRAVLAIVHGFGEHSDRYGNIVHALLPHGIGVCAFDLRGHGRSSGQRGHIDSWQDFRQDVRAFLDHVRQRVGEVPIFLFGHSMGGLIVLDYALETPQGLAGVIASGPVLAQPGVSPVLIFVSRLVSRLYPRFSMDTHLDASALSRDPEVVRAYEQDPLVHSRASARLGTELTATVERVQARASRWTLPLLILHGSDDRLAPPEGSRTFFDNVAIADKTYKEYPGGYHEPHNDIQKEQAIQDVLDWLEGHLTQGAA